MGKPKRTVKSVHPCEIAFGTKQYREGVARDFDEGIETVTEILDACSVLLNYQGEQIENEEATSCLSFALHGVLAEQAQYVKRLHDKAKVLSMPPRVVVPAPQIKRALSAKGA